MSIQKLGPYKLDGIVGRGGMGTVYRSIHQETGEEYAVKVLSPYYATDPHFRARFESEIKALIKLDHPNIVRLISYGQEESNLFFAMELVHGKSLFQLQRERNRFDWREVIQMAQQISKGLRHAHDRGVIHRDLKPGNLLLSEEGVVKITDFGIAKNFGASQNTGNNVLGTMDFMSPEQAKGKPVTIRSDLYSLGTLMYTLLSGAPPFSGNSVEESLRNLTKVPAPRVNARAPDVPAPLADLISTLMQKRPEKRISTAQALLHQLDRIEQDLRDYSEAQTAERPQVAVFTNSQDTMADVGREADGDATKHHDITEVSPDRKNTNDSQPKADQTVAVKKKSVIRDSGSNIDYFNTVTEQQRQRQSGVQQDKPTSVSGILAVGIPLVLLLLIGGFGVYWNTLPPTSDQLFADITKQKEEPFRVLDEIGSFLEYYPEDERIEEIKSLRQMGVAMQLFNYLSYQRNRNGPNRISQIENQFVDAIYLSDTDMASAISKLDALIELYGSEELEENEKACIDACRAYSARIRSQAEERKTDAEAQIAQAMKRAEKSDSPETIYQSIIELYGNADWAKESVDEARQRLEKIQSMDQLP